MGSFKIAQPLPVAGVNQVDPFLLIHHAGPVYQKPGDNFLRVPSHPHRGFETVTATESLDINATSSIYRHYLFDIEMFTHLNLTTSASFSIAHNHAARCRSCQ